MVCDCDPKVDTVQKESLDGNTTYVYNNAFTNPFPLVIKPP
jgi:hypothetical protein